MQSENNNYAAKSPAVKSGPIYTCTVQTPTGPVRVSGTLNDVLRTLSAGKR